MKLTKQEIEFINNYLIKNKVKYWDVRLELLDHIVTAVEDKTTNQGISFNEALLEVHLGFGNQLIKGSVSSHEILNKGLYQSNIGFQKFIRQEQKEIGKKQRKKFWSSLLPFVFSIRFLLEVLLLTSITYLAYLYSLKTSLLVLIITIGLLEFSKMFYGGFKKFSNTSLNMQVAISASLLIMQLPYLTVMLFNWSFEDVENKPYYLLFIMGFIAIVISRHGLNNYINTYKTYKKRYSLLMS